MKSTPVNFLWSRRRWLAQLGRSAALAGSYVATTPVLAAQPGWLSRLSNTLEGNAMNPENIVMKWEVDFCSYGLDIDPKGQTRTSTLWTDNWLKDAEGNYVAKFYSGFGAAWGRGSSDMGGTDPEGSRLPKIVRLTYYDYLEDRFYRLDAELPLQRIAELFVRAPKTVAKQVKYAAIVPFCSILRFGIAPRGNIMLWAAGANQVELQTFQAQVLPGMDPKSYNASLPGGTFKLTEDRWEELGDARNKPETLEKIKAGWVPDPDWYMRHIRVKFPWRHVLTGNFTRLTELQSYQCNGEMEDIGNWQVEAYKTNNVMRSIPDTAKFWFHDLTGQRHYLWVSFSLRDRAVSESDLSEVRAAFDQMFPGRQMEDNAFLPSDIDMARVEVNVTEDFKNITATLVKGDVRLPLPVGRTQHFALQPFTHWAGKGNTSESVTPAIRKLFQYGPGL